MAKIQSVCVFCGARDTIPQKYQDLAFKCGESLAKQNIAVVYGGGASGMMGALARGAMLAKGRVVSVYPKVITGKEQLIDDSNELCLVNTMSERKDMMIERSDAFLILPGGVGTLDEAFEVITLNVLEIIKKPIVFVNTDGFWDFVYNGLHQIIDEGFARENLLNVFTVVNTLDEAMQELKI